MMKMRGCSAMTIEKILEERAKTHGDYTETAVAQQAIKTAIRSGPNWDSLPDIIKESLEMIAHKLGRIVAGNPYVVDHYRDIVGYSTLVIDRIEDGVGLKQPAATEPAEDAGATLGRTLDLMRTRAQIGGVVGDLTNSAADLMEQMETAPGPRNMGGFALPGNPGFKVGPIEPVHGPVSVAGEQWYPDPDNPGVLKPRHKPAVSGTPEDGGHHARQAEEPERVIMSLGPEDVGKWFKTRGGELVQIIDFQEGHNFPVHLNHGSSDNARMRVRTRRGRMNWQIEPHADDIRDIVESVGVFAS
jgi:hypothetical protein